jgi:hypothetical protein
MLHRKTTIGLGQGTEKWHIQFNDGKSGADPGFFAGRGPSLKRPGLSDVTDICRAQPETGGARGGVPPRQKNLRIYIVFGVI